MTLLDAEAEKAVAASSNDSSAFIPERKHRIVPSALQPPPNAPSWSVQSTVESITGMLVYFIVNFLLLLVIPRGYWIVRCTFNFTQHNSNPKAGSSRMLGCD